MSGGVDSSTVAALLKKEGFDLVGITMQVWPQERFDDEIADFGGCCSLAAVDDARRVAESLEIPHYTLNFRDIFREKVIDDFLAQYSAGKTPNPCIRCNQFIKFEALMAKAMAIDCDFLATGHYANIRHDASLKRFTLSKGADASKDQSYFLYTMTQDQLKQTMFPLGEYKKTETRMLAKQFELPVADKKESQEICFVPDDNYAEYIKKECPDAAVPGEITDKEGNVIGAHQGIIYYTCGQRKGLGISHEKPLYVIEIDKESNRLIVGEEEDLYGDKFTAGEINCLAFKELPEEFRADVKIRYNSEAVPSTLRRVNKNKLEVSLDKPKKAITPGQAAVFYDGDKVLGGGTIEKIGAH